MAVGLDILKFCPQHCCQPINNCCP